ncbi:MAG: MBOAT family protein [Lachnospiraceae bacterium]|nr:MBOAT family protein [Lachnospiraceae bacterium]
MVFNSYVFIFLMLPISVAGYYLINRISNMGGKWFLLACSLFFVGYVNVMYLAILMPSILINYLFGFLINGVFKDNNIRRKGVTVLGVVLNLVTLGVFKYSDFFIANVNQILKKDFTLCRLILPLGISFYTFQQISFLVDYYRDNTLSCTLLEYCLYISFYPQFVQGPIVLQSEFIPQLREEKRRHWDSRYASKGLYRFTLGLAKKVLIADTIAKAVDGGYDRLSEVTALGAVALILGYTLQIYFDFSAYSDMAIGLGYFFHIDLPENFNSPYKARTIDEFWDRWHITLTRFFTRYLYFPLGGSRKGRVRTYINILIVFILSGLWHGAEWSFVLWGAMHGVAMLISRLIRDISGSGKNSDDDSIKNRIAFVSIIQTCITFIFVNVAWVFFRADNTSQAIDVISKVFKGGWNGMTEYIHELFGKVVEIAWLLRLDVLNLNDKVPGIILIFVLIALMFICMLTHNSKELTDRWADRINMMADTNEVSGRSLTLLVSSAAMAVLLTWSIVSLGGVTSYIYWNF